MVSLGENGSMTGTRLSDLPGVVASRLRNGDWRGLYTRSTEIDPQRYTEDAKAVLKQADAEVRSRATKHSVLSICSSAYCLLAMDGSMLRSLSENYLASDLLKLSAARFNRGTSFGTLLNLPRMERQLKGRDSLA
jgi:hypothetical protein